LPTPLTGLRARCINASHVPLPAPAPLLAALLHLLFLQLLLPCDKPLKRQMCVTAWTRREGAGARKTTWTRSCDATCACVVASAHWRPWAKRGRPAPPPPPAQYTGVPESHACSKYRQSISQLLLRAVASQTLNCSQSDSQLSDSQLSWPQPPHASHFCALWAQRMLCASLPPLLASPPHCRITWLGPEEGAKAECVRGWRKPHQCLALGHAAFPDRRQACAYVSSTQYVCVCA